MAFIKTLNPVDISGGQSGGHCHGGTPPLTSTIINIRINGNIIMGCGTGNTYAGISCEGLDHPRNTSPLAAYPLVRANNIPIFTSDDFLECGELGGFGINPVFIN